MSFKLTVKIPAARSRDAQIRRRLFLGTVSNTVGQSVTLGAGFFLTPLLLHALGPTTYGLWVLVASLVGFGSLLDFGIWGTLIKYVAEYRATGKSDDAHALIATSLVLYSLFGLLTIAASVIVSPLFVRLFNVPLAQQMTAQWLFIVMGSAIGLFMPCMTAHAVLRGLQRYDIVNMVSVVGTVTEVVAVVVMLRLNAGVFGVVAANMIGILVTQALAIAGIGRVAPELRFGWRGAQRRLVRPVLSYSWPLFLKDLAARLQTKSDEITISLYLPVGFVAPYSVARRLSEITHLLTKQFMKVLLPMASELHATSDLARLRALYLSGTRLTLVISLPIGVTLAILARPILTLWVGSDFASYYPIVVILTLASLVVTSNWPATALLQGIARHRILAATAVGSGIANLLLSLFLVRRMGLVGVALGTLIPSTIENLLFVLPYTLHILKVDVRALARQVLAPTLLPTLSLISVLHLLRPFADPFTLARFLIVGGGGLLVYLLVYLLAGAPTHERQAYLQVARHTFQFAETTLKRH